MSGCVTSSARRRDVLADALRHFAHKGPGLSIAIDGETYTRNVERRIEIVDYVTVFDARGHEVLITRRMPDVDAQP